MTSSNKKKTLSPKIDEQKLRIKGLEGFMKQLNLDKQQIE